MNSLVRILFLCVLFNSSLPAQENQANDEYLPLYAGTLLAFYPSNAAPGYLSIQPYIFFTKNDAFYNAHWSRQTKKPIYLSTLSVSLETGITQFLDVSLILNETYNRLGSRHSLLYGDMQAYLGFQALRDKKGTAIPDLRILLGENFPTGKYKNLDPKKQGSDISGVGSFETILLVVLSKVFYLFPKHPFDLNLNLFYIVPAKTHVHGFSFYGGGPGTEGTAKPGNQFIANLAFEYSVNRFWALGIDMRYEHFNSSPFSGKKGIDPILFPTGRPSTERISIAPCLEYCYSEDFSLAGGFWFTVAGRNAQAFVSTIFNVFYYF